MFLVLYHKILMQKSDLASMTAVSGSILAGDMTGIDPHIFRAYDIRGKAHTQLSDKACWWIGAGFGSVLREKYGKNSAIYRPSVIVGRDARTHSPELEQALIDGLMSAGCAVKRIGQTPSPVNYFTICDRKADGGAQITASHNPKEDNGVKLQVRDAQAHAGEDLQVLKRRIDAKEVLTGKGSVETIDAIEPYLHFLDTLFGHVGKGKKVVVDGGNGVAGPVYTEALRRAGCEVIGMYIEPDGTFPNHPADPSKHATLAELQKKVVEEKAHAGFAFDGDGDRLGLVDDKGNIVTADQVILLLAQDHLKRHPGKPVIFTVSNSGLLETEIKKWGGVPVMSKVGHSFVEHAMREHGALLGGEQSGHFFCSEGYFGFDDALVATMRVLAILAANVKVSLSTMIEAFPKVYQAQEMRPHCPDDKKADIVRRISEYFAAKYPVNTLDGARIDFGDGAWAGVRYSNTSPCLSICVEARSGEKLAAVEEEVLGHVRTYGEIDLKS